jgi:hypothetical protein
MPCRTASIKGNQGATAVKFHEMTFPELRKVPRDSTVVLAPIAACEQHSHHLPTFTDTILVTGVAEGVEQQMPEQVLLLPTQWMGAALTTSASGQRFRPRSIRTSTCSAICSCRCSTTATSAS